MKIIDVAQGSSEWLAARLGRPTASQFHRIITPSGKPSTAADAYIAELVAEWMLGCPLEPEESAFMQRGTALEAEAVAYYEMMRGVTMERPGFVVRDAGDVGCSPDGLVRTLRPYGEGPPAYLEELGGVEIKCPKPANHVATLLEDVPAKHAPQIQGNIWVLGAAWWDFLSYHPTLPPALVRVCPDRDFLEALEKHMRAFLVRLEAAKETVRALGYEPVVNPLTPAELLELAVVA